ncbi:hypothetical protein PspLS_10302 [Pyricularia sp. CBS 133598]|nr:hypothetical protein PspLS_10302 [Pyricularia sp. CBS 133598]
MPWFNILPDISNLTSQDGNHGVALTYAPYVVTAFLLFALVYSQRDSYPELPYLNPKGPLELTWRRRLADYMVNSRDLLAQGKRKFGDKPYKMFTDLGSVIIVPPKYTDELKSHRGLDFIEQGLESAHSYIPGFDAFDADSTFVKVVNNHLTKALMKLTAPLMEEATTGLNEIWGNSKEWREMAPMEIMYLVSRISSRIFMGEELCKDQEWVEASAQWADCVFRAVFTLRGWPRFLRPYVHWFIPDANLVRQRVRVCREVLQPHIDRRNAVKAEAIARGEPSPFNDSIEWFAREYSTPFDPATKQLTLSLFAIHTTTDLLVSTLADLAKHPEIIKPLREEVISVLSAEGLKKSAFQKLRLMDAVFKESQRLRPLMLAFFRRKAMEDITLSDGFCIKKGTLIAMDGTQLLRDEELYPEPLRWNPYRFLQMREAGQENKAHLVSVSTQHFGFGHGLHACPGRFFAANELKIALAQIILKYDITLPDDAKNLPEAMVGSNYVVPKGTRFLIRRRQEELDFDSLDS